MSIISILLSGFELNKHIHVLKNDIVIEQQNAPIDKLAECAVQLCYANDIYDVAIYADIDTSICDKIRNEIYEYNKTSYEEKNNIKVEVVE